MGSRVFFLNRLHATVDRAEYERWVQEVDYPFARALPAINSYEVYRLQGPLRDGEVPYDYIEVVEVTDLDDYRADLSGLPEEFVTGWRTFVADSIAVHSTVIG
jgi:hypothetical protein